MKRKFAYGGATATNAVAPAAPTKVWGYKGCAGKGGETAKFIYTPDTKTEEKEHD